jgi:anti-anti-sigma factor
MQFSIDDAGMTAKLVLNGKFDVSSAETVAEPLTRLAEQKHGLIVDLARVSYLASSGIRQLVTAAKAMTRRGGRLVLLNPTKPVEEVLTISATNSLIPLARSEKEAQAIIAAALGG